MKLLRAAQNSAFKNHPRNILCDENHLYSTSPYNTYYSIKYNKTFTGGHDALVDIVCHALSQSHSGVLKEQRVSYEDNSRPGDVYHPDFQHGRPAYFLYCIVLVLYSDQH